MLPDRIAIGVLHKTFPPGLVDEVIDAVRARELWKRSLPARLTAYSTLAMSCGVSTATRKCCGS